MLKMSIKIVREESPLTERLIFNVILIIGFDYVEVESFTIFVEMRIAQGSLESHQVRDSTNIIS